MVCRTNFEGLNKTAEEAAKSLSAGFRRSKLFKRENAEEEKERIC
jgi:hypothetical protein